MEISFFEVYPQENIVSRPGGKGFIRKIFPILMKAPARVCGSRSASPQTTKRCPILNALSAFKVAVQET
jgi:hypothetical protein